MSYARQTSDRHQGAIHATHCRICPESLPDVLLETPAELEKEMRSALAVRLFEMKRIPSGIAATPAGTDRVGVLMELSRYGPPAIDPTKEEPAGDGLFAVAEVT